MLTLIKVSQDVSVVDCSIAATDGSDPLLQLLRKVPSNDPAEAELSRSLARHYLNWAYRSHQNLSLKASDRIQSALAKITELRNQPNMSSSLQLRNAEYYLHGLYSGISMDPAHLALTTLAPVYVQYKAAAKTIGFESWLRTIPESPTSDPGGFGWAWNGLRDSIDIKNTEIKGSRLGFVGDLPTLRKPHVPPAKFTSDTVTSR